jgi:DNA-binding response OmpR family regulator
VLVIGDDPLFGASLLIALRHERYDAQLVAESDLDLALSEVCRSPRGVAVLDLQRSHGRRTEVDRFALLSPLLEEGWTVLVVSSGPCDEARAAVAVSDGAVGVLTKTSTVGELLLSIKAAAEGHPVMTLAEREEWLSRYRDYRRLAGDLGALFSSRGTRTSGAGLGPARR